MSTSRLALQQPQIGRTLYIKILDDDGSYRQMRVEHATIFIVEKRKNRDGSEVEFLIGGGYEIGPNSVFRRLCTVEYVV